MTYHTTFSTGSGSRHLTRFASASSTLKGLNSEASSNTDCHSQSESIVTQSTSVPLLPPSPDHLIDINIIHDDIRWDHLHFILQIQSALEYLQYGVVALIILAMMYHFWNAAMVVYQQQQCIDGCATLYHSFPSQSQQYIACAKTCGLSEVMIQNIQAQTQSLG